MKRVSGRCEEFTRLCFIGTLLTVGLHTPAHGTTANPTIREKFDTYRVADPKERVFELLARVVTVSVETLRIVGEIEGAAR